MQSDLTENKIRHVIIIVKVNHSFDNYFRTFLMPMVRLCRKHQGGFQISSEYLEKEKSRQIEEIKRRTSLFLVDDITRSSNSDLLTNSLPVCFRLRDRELITEF